MSVVVYLFINSQSILRHYGHVWRDLLVNLLGRDAECFQSLLVHLVFERLNTVDLLRLDLFPRLEMLLLHHLVVLFLDRSDFYFFFYEGFCLDFVSGSSLQVLHDLLFGCLVPFFGPFSDQNVVDLLRCFPRLRVLRYFDFLVNIVLDNYFCCLGIKVLFA